MPEITANADHPEHTGSGLAVSRWLQLLGQPSLLSSFRAVYGDDAAFLHERARLAFSVLQRFIERFGDQPVRLFRAPGRINLRGMHVDTHGGFLNLMTHHREILAAVHGIPERSITCVNTDREFREFTLDLAEEACGLCPGTDWNALFGHVAVRARVRTRSGEPGVAWANYLAGAAMRLQCLAPDCPLQGMQAVIGGDLPRGASLSSSAALSTVALLAMAAINGFSLSTKALIRAEQEVEWYSGARVGMSDQTAILMGRPGQMLHLAVFAEDLDLSHARYTAFPETLRVLAVNSLTTRSLSGAQRLQYSKNRFSYSIAMTVLRDELQRQGMPASEAAALDRLSRLNPQVLGGTGRMYELLRAVPMELTLQELKQRYRSEGIQDTYDQYFGDLEPGQRPQVFSVRGPLIFGIAESMRAELFFEAVAAGDAALMGRLMSAGHDGDRVMDASGNPYVPPVDDAALHALAKRNLSLVWCPGAYGASSPALDMLVDAAMAGKALGACLTGAGIAGTILALCHADSEAEVRDKLLAALQSERYRGRANLTELPDSGELAEAVVANRAVGGACELLPGNH